MKECNRICEWNNPSNGCVKPETVDCKMPNLFKGAKPQTNAERMISLIQNGKVRDLLDWWEEIFEDGVPGDDYFEWWLKLPVKGDNE